MSGGVPGMTLGVSAVKGANLDKKGSPQYVYVSDTLQGGPNFAGAVDIYPAIINGNICLDLCQQR